MEIIADLPESAHDALIKIYNNKATIRPLFKDTEIFDKKMINIQNIIEDNTNFWTQQYKEGLLRYILFIL
jgi:hypothetical protein